MDDTDDPPSLVEIDDRDDGMVPELLDSEMSDTTQLKVPITIVTGMVARPP